MIQLQLKAKHFFFIANDLKNVAAYQFFDLLNNIKAATTNKQDEDLVTVETSVDNLVYVFRLLSEKKEGEANIINTQMMKLITPQIQAGAGANNPEWLQVYQQITEVREANWAVTAEAIVNGKNFLHQ